MGQINKIPLGYLNMLGSQTGGKNPFDASEIVNPVVVMDPFYHAQAMAVSTDVLAATAHFDSVTRVVPDNEAWMLYAWGVSTTSTGTGDRIRWQLSISRLPRSNTPNLGCVVFQDNTVLTPNETITSYGASKYFENPIPLTAGAEITSTVQHITNNQTSTIQYLYAKFTA